MKGQDILILLKLARLDSALAVPDGAVREKPASGYLASDSPDHHEDHAESAHPPASVRGLESSLGISKSEVSKSLKRSLESGLLLPALSGKGRRVNRPALSEFLIHGIRYVFPARPGPLVSGLPTAVDAPVFDKILSRGGGLPSVWPDPNSKVLGEAINPLYPSAPAAARRDRGLYDLLALIDSLRLGQARERNCAADLLQQRLIASPPKPALVNA